MTLLATTSRPSTFLTTSSSKQTADIFALITPAITHSLYLATAFQALLSTTTVFILLKSSLVYQFIRVLGIALLSHFKYASLLLAQQLRLGLSRCWERTEKMRKRLFFEFMVFVLGSGNGLLLFLFWPGWIFLGAGLLGFWTIRG